MGISFNLESVLEELGITKNHLAVESKVRPATVLYLAKGEIKRVDLETANTLLNTLNKISQEKGLNKIYTLNDILPYEYIENTKKD